MKRLTWLILPFFMLMTACGYDNALTKEEMQVQSAASLAVSEILFEAHLESEASYHVRKNGLVKIEFTEAVSVFDYTAVVEQLRQHASIAAVEAVQSGNRVCPLN